MWTAPELKQKFVSFFEHKSHAEIPSSSLVPDNDPSTLFISAGMHPLVPYLLGQPHPLGNRLVDVQKCVRTGDIDEVGDTTHHTFFEMLGNWSLGDYFKDEAITWSYEFLTKQLGIDPNNLFVTCFEGDSDAPKDNFSGNVWQKLGIPLDRIVYLPKDDNWWGPAGSTGPCGPDTEMFVDTTPHLPKVDFITGSKQKRYVEIWNNVFMQYFKDATGNFTPLSQQNVDTGMGVERTLAVLNGFSDNYLTSIWTPILNTIQTVSGKTYDTETSTSMRIIADHLRAAVFIATDGVKPSNKEAGYVLRRLIRRSIRQCRLLGITGSFAPILESIYQNQTNLAGHYPELDQHKTEVVETLLAEEKKFSNTLISGLKEIQKLIDKKRMVTGEEAFKIYESFGFPIEMIQEELQKHNLTLDKVAFEQMRKQHQDASRTLSAGKFKSGLADNSEVITRMHTATHLLHAALRQVLGPDVHQAGSNNTAERLRFDFTYPQKLTPQEISQITQIINQTISQDLPVSVQSLPFVEAQKLGAMALFGNRYPEIVTVYTIGDSSSPFSREVCTGPHVSSTKEVGKFEIIKEEAVSSGVRRIYAHLS